MQIKVTTTTGEHLVDFDSVADSVAIQGPDKFHSFGEVTGLEIVADPPAPEPVQLDVAAGVADPAPEPTPEVAPEPATDAAEPVEDEPAAA